MTKKEQQNLIHNIKLLKKRNGWTTLELATKADISKRGIEYILSGRKIPRPNTIQGIADAFGVPVSVLTAPKMNEAYAYYNDALNRVYSAVSKELSESDSNDTHLMHAIQKYISKDHIKTRNLLERFGYRIIYIPTFKYTRAQYAKCIKQMKEYHHTPEKAKTQYTTDAEKYNLSPEQVQVKLWKQWDILDEDDALEQILSDKREWYVNETINYPILINKIEEIGTNFSLYRHFLNEFPLDIRILRLEDVRPVSQISLSSFVDFSKKLHSNIKDSIEASVNYQTYDEIPVSLLPSEARIDSDKLTQETIEQLNIHKINKS